MDRVANRLVRDKAVGDPALEADFSRKREGPDRGRLAELARRLVHESAQLLTRRIIQDFGCTLWSLRERAKRGEASSLEGTHNRANILRRTADELGNLGRVEPPRAGQKDLAPLEREYLGRPKAHLESLSFFRCQFSNEDWPHTPDDAASYIIPSVSLETALGPRFWRNFHPC